LQFERQNTNISEKERKIASQLYDNLSVLTGFVPPVALTREVPLDEFMR